ncbi:ScyD/ScyE family protein [Kribbella sp. CA-294648]|uniref:ScyD/ScyE family protein n=1 Tax=Kribbella sp. CA-294648 TaxID=3239948 RepID=UPI003D89D55C
MGVRRTARIAAVSAVALVSTVLVAGQAEGSGGYGGSLKPVVTGLNGPRGVAAHGAKVVYSVGDGSVYEAWAYGTNKGIRELGTVPGGFAPAIDTDRWGTTYALTGAGGEPGQPLPPGGASLFKLRPGKAPLKIADIGQYQLKDPDPYNVEGPATESNPFGVATLRDGSVLVADAAGNDLLRVWPNGKIRTVARLKPRVVKAPANLGGQLMPAEAVSTSVTVGSDGHYYVGELRGFPATPGTSQIWRIKPGSMNAVCDPAKPYKGHCQRYADGYTSIVDLSAGRHGKLAVVQLANIGWLAWEMSGQPTAVGGLFLQYPGKHHKAGYKKELARGKLHLPAGTEINKFGHVFVSSPLFGPGAVYRIR